jgi:lysozyme family protein
VRTVDQILDVVIAREEPSDPSIKTINRPADKGGLTSRYGVTFDEYNRWRKAKGKGPVTPTDFGDAVTKDEAKAFMLDEIAGPLVGLLPIDEALFALLLDWAETSSPEAPTRALQTTLRTFGLEVSIDGVCGSETVKAVATYLATTSDGLRILRRRLAINRGEFYVLLALHDSAVRQFRVQHNDTNLENLHGWYLRAMEDVP